jgi:hypothetical protein
MGMADTERTVGSRLWAGFACIASILASPGCSSHRGQTPATRTPPPPQVSEPSVPAPQSVKDLVGTDTVSPLNQANRPTPEGGMPDAGAAGLCRPVSRHAAETGSPRAKPECRPPVTGRAIESIRYAVSGRNGTAGRSVDSGGFVEGHHVRPTPAGPFVTMEHGCVSEPCIAALWQLAAECAARPTSETRKGSTNARSITITLAGGRDVELTWPSEQRPPSPVIRSLASLLAEMEIGYW